MKIILQRLMEQMQELHHFPCETASLDVLLTTKRLDFIRETTIMFLIGSVAQLAEQLTLNQLVVGSSPTGVTLPIYRSTMRFFVAS